MLFPVIKYSLTAFLLAQEAAEKVVERATDAGTTKLVNNLQGASTEGATKLVNDADNVPINEVTDVGKQGDNVDEVVKITPSRDYDALAIPRGPRTTIGAKVDDAERRSLTRENETADTLAKNGYDVEQNPKVPDSRNPDYMIEGVRFDCYSPANKTRSENVYSTIVEKVVEKEQAPRIVVNLDDWEGEVSDLIKQLNDYPIEGLEEVIIVKDGIIKSIYP